MLQLDDEFIGYIFRFSSEITDLLHTNLTGVHDIFKKTAFVEEPEFEKPIKSHGDSPLRREAEGQNMLDFINQYESP